jgi:spore coat protein U-like protein
MTTINPAFNPNPATVVFAITCSDSVDLPQVINAIRATTAGNIKITCLDGTTPTLAFTAGETRHVCATRVWSTGTDHTTGNEGMA